MRRPSGNILGGNMWTKGLHVPQPSPSSNLQITVYVKNFVVYLISWFSRIIKIHEFFHEKAIANARNLLHFILTSSVVLVNQN